MEVFPILSHLYLCLLVKPKLAFEEHTFSPPPESTSPSFNVTGTIAMSGSHSGSQFVCGGLNMLTD